VTDESVSVWLYDLNGVVVCINIIPVNIPPYVISSFDSVKEARERATKMEDEGWRIIVNNLKGENIEEK